MKKKKILHLIAPGYSGSTLLSYMLGSHSQILNIGEYPQVIKRNNKIKCLSCMEKECPIWDLFSITELKRYYHTFNFFRRGRGTTLKLHILKFLNNSRILPGPGFLYRRIFKKFTQHIILDGAKDFKWASYNSRNTNYEHYYLFLVRDLRALTSSRMRKFKEPVDVALELQYKKLKVRVDAYKKLNKPKLLVRYEDMSQNPQKKLIEISEFIGIAYEHEMLDYLNKKQHILGGSMTVRLQQSIETGAESKHLEFEGKEYYEKKEKNKIMVDERWKSELNSEEIEYINLKFSDLNMSLGYIL